MPGIGNIRTEDDIPEDLDIRSCVIVERTPPTRLADQPEPGERSFEIHTIGGRAKPALGGAVPAGRDAGPSEIAPGAGTDRGFGTPAVRVAQES